MVSELMHEQLQNGFMTVLILAGLPLICSMFVGLVISVLQAATQIQEQTLTFVPKLMVMGAILYFAGDFLFMQLELLFSSSLEKMVSVQQ